MGRGRVHRLIWVIFGRCTSAALLVAAAISFVSASSMTIFVPRDAEHVSRIILVIAVSGFSVAATLGHFIVRYVTRRAFGWSDSERGPTAIEIRRIARIPRFAAKYIGGAWLLTVPVMMFAADRAVPGLLLIPGVLAGIALIFGLAAIAASFLAYLLVEQAIRPILSDVLPSDPETWPPTIGVTSRLTIVSLIVSVGPLVVIGSLFAVLNNPQRARAGATILIGCVEFAAIGFIAFFIAGRTITNPLEGLRAHMRRVADGDLRADVDAVEGGEIGLLQVGFNQMVEGLRERERVRDVFGRHVGTDVAQRALMSDFASAAESGEATVVFVDILGSTALTERSTPDEVVRTLNEFFDKVVRVVTSEGGLVNKFLGDGALCIFGAPYPVEDHAVRGLRAARALSAELSTLQGVLTGIGVASGEVVAGNLGAADRYEYTVIGDAVNEASRLCDAAKTSPSRILASDRTINAAADESHYWLRAETVQLRGKAKPTVTYVPAAV